MGNYIEMWYWVRVRQFVLFKCYYAAEGVNGKQRNTTRMLTAPLLIVQIPMRANQHFS